LLNYIGGDCHLQSWFSQLSPILFGLMVLLRVGEEETVLVVKFGDNYHDYMKRTGRFSPKI
jgi:protein-S-isoprenylcysteine O-methyltransferase Ste14